MSEKLSVGPILGLESETGYTVCFVTAKSIRQAEVIVAGRSHQATLIASLYSGNFWRTAFSVGVEEGGAVIDYQVRLDGKSALDQQSRHTWKLYVPGKDEKPRMAYASCNGFSDLKLMNSTDRPYALWKEMASKHQESPFSLLIMGGDQVYADALWSSVPSLKAWNELDRKEKIRRKPTRIMKAQLDRFYSELYISRWRKNEVANLLASVPSVMMWDDHDIFDGWGSYPSDLQNCPVYKLIYEVASRYFEWFQLRSKENKSLLNQSIPRSHAAFAFTFRNTHILGLDNRSERTLSQVMSPEQWGDVSLFLSAHQEKGDLFVLSGVPVVYRDFSFTETAVDFTPWEEELTDDLKDHWRAREHQGERAKLIMRLLENAGKRQARTVIFSGDVHVGCFGVIQDRRSEKKVLIHQVVSSGIVHPPPTNIQWLGIRAVTNDDTEYLDEERAIRIDLIRPHGSKKYLRTRNFVTLQEGKDEKLWINWVCENGEKPLYPLQ